MIKRIPIEDLELGMYVVGLDTPWIRTPFLIHKFLIKSVKQIDKLRDYGVKWVDIDTSKGKDHKNALPVEASSEEFDNNFEKLAQHVTPKGDIPGVSYEEEIVQSKRVYRDVKKLVEETMNDVRLGRGIHMPKLNEASDSMINSLLRNKNAFLSLARLKSYDQYTFYHSVNVSILSLSVGIFLDYHRTELQMLGAGGLLHDIGKTRVPDNILNKPGKLTEAEFSIIKKHVEYGQQILANTENIPKNSLIMLLEHHERFDGSGYPQGLKGKDISYPGGIAGIADVFDALTTERVYKKAMLPQDALREMYKMGKSFIPSLLERFIQCIGIYPVGSLVKLNTGETGLVIENDLSDLLRPKVRLIMDRRGYWEPQLKVADLKKKNLQTNMYFREIKGLVNPKTLGLDPNIFIESLTSTL